MSQFKTLTDTKVFYTDTDSIVTDKPLKDSQVGKELGKMKLEHNYNEAVFLSPKVYSGKTDSYITTKIKGFTSKIGFDMMKMLLLKKSNLILSQDKWYKNLSDGNILVKSESYSLMITENKRKLVYNSQNIFEKTLPLTIKGGNIIEE